MRISPDGTRAALLGATSGNGDVWIYEFARGTFSRLTFTGTNAAPTWSADGRSVYYSSFDATGTASTVFKKLADGSRDPTAVATVAARTYVTWVNPTETAAIIDAANPLGDRGDILRVTFGASSAPEKLVATPANEFAGAVSPKGNWLAYQSDETGRPEIYVRDFGGSGARWQVTFEAVRSRTGLEMAASFSIAAQTGWWQCRWSRGQLSGTVSREACSTGSTTPASNRAAASTGDRTD
jgi:serine/threonine-protein kinase